MNFKFIIKFNFNIKPVIKIFNFNIKAVYSI